MSDSLQPHRRQPTRLPRPWGSPGKNTGVGCHVLFQCMKVKSEIEVTQSCPTLIDPMDCSLPGSSVHGIFQASVLEWGAIAFSGVQGSRSQKKPRFPDGFQGSVSGFEDLYSLCPEKAVAAHSSALAWKESSTWTEGPGGLQSMGRLRVGHG